MTAAVIPIKKLSLRERNQKVIERALVRGDDYSILIKNLTRKFGESAMKDFSQKITEGNLSWKKLERKLMEADSAQSFVQFLRAGVNQIMMGAYQATSTTYEDWVTITSSKVDTDLYTPNHGVSFPRQVGPQELYPEVGAAALDIKLQNLKYGSVYSIQKELLNDDQSGSFAQQQSLMGEYLKILSEVLCYGKLASVANMQYIDYQIPISETKPSTEANYPWSQSFVGGGANRPAVYTVVTQTGLQNAKIGLMNQKNLQGIKMQVDPDLLIVGTNQQFEAALLLNSAYYPSGAAAAGAVGGAFAINPMKGIYDLIVSRFVFKNDATVDGTSKAWYVVDSKKPFFVQQLREPVAVTQEDPNSGESFNRDVYRFKASTRMNADWLDPRFAWQGNDGSVTA